MFLEAEAIIGVTILVVVIIILATIALVVLLTYLNKKRIQKMFENIETLLNKIVDLDKENSELKKIEYDSKKSPRPAYDYILKTKSFAYYIKVVDNHSGYEICVNNSVKWQIRKSINDESMNFVPDIEELMRMELPKDDDRIAKKLYLIYPGARSLLRYINECEMEFVHPNTDVYGTNLITYNDLNENLDFIPREYVKTDKDKNTQLSLNLKI